MRTVIISVGASVLMFGAGTAYGSNQQQPELAQTGVIQVRYGRSNHSMDWLDGADRWLVENGASGDVDGSNYRSFDPWQSSSRRVRSSSWNRRYGARCY